MPEPAKVKEEKKEEGINRTTVTIFDHEYVLKGTETPEYMRALAAYVDRKMRQVGEKNPHYPPVKIAVLAALNIADELNKIRQDYETLIRLIQEERKG
ncbi:cell division protein ZapA [Thermanaeromonas sp. C210]|uniref:cell division protein ZapA n=1 Tax=Thermanaeromonas sp. C210 TaxID=2731925 RepID=UPI00155C4D9A|nr:cell division protein ZapA [Thermanaeromonas sp. C210]GFN23161.1 cell division protein ZapA [Thermanaeromonas sp. C210]